MIEFTLKLAGFPISAAVNYESTRSFCAAYLTPEPPQLSVSVTEEDIAAEARESADAGFSPNYLERLALYRQITRALQSRNVLLFHGSALALEGQVILFTAPSGTGKTTHTRLWLKNIPGCHVLNGDKPLLKFTDDGVLVCGTPWQGKENYGCNEILPLGALCLLERSAENRIERIDFHAAFSTLITQTYHPDEGAMLRDMQLLGALAKLPLYRLGCNMDDEAAFVSRRGIIGE